MSIILSVSARPVSVAVDRLLPDTDFIYALAPLPPVFKKLMEPPSGDVLETLDPVPEDPNILRQLSKVYSTSTLCTLYDNSLHEYVARRKLFQRQNSIDEQDSIPTEGVSG